ncbi:hypothetical protein HPULCUR_003767 [Helicostylum pulchrum]|uniref:Protein kinase domain-containing protein n=1 Tax=Helicostylum pulchrum TaxID=562976 RepID=A0ABP9XVM5_9FUNG
MPVTQKKGFVNYKDFKPLLSGSRLAQTNVLLKKATIQYTSIIENRYPNFKRDLLFIPRRTLTNPREPSKNDGHDNINDDYILVVNDPLGEKYTILDLMGQGTFGQVVKCKVKGTDQLVAVKIIKRQPAFLYQGDKEIQILLKLKNRPKEKDKFLQLLDSFSFRGHTCAVLELLSISLHKLFTQLENGSKLTINDIQKISFHILETLALLKEMRIIHTDLKPDNILLKSLDDIHNVKLIDYGSALMETEQLNYCVQTASYRSPEVILHVPFDCAIDMWSFGCFVAEMFLGRPLFASGNELTLLHMMVPLLGSLPSDHMLKQGRRTNEFFHLKSGTETKLREHTRNSHDIVISKATLAEEIMGFKSYDDDDSIIDNYQEMTERGALLDFLSKILVFDPSIRLTPKAALQHPFITSAMNNATTSSLSGDTLVHKQPTHTTRPLSSNSIFGLTNNSSSINTSRTEDSVKTPLNYQENLSQSTPYKSLSKTPSVSPPITTTKTPQIIVSPSPTNVRTATVSPSTKALKSILKKPATDYQPFVPPQVPAQQENTLDSRLALFYPLPPRPNSIVPVTTVAGYSTIDQNPQYQLYNNTNANSESQYRRATASKSPNQLFQQYLPPTIVNNMGYYLDPQPFLTTPTSPLLYNAQYDVHRPNKQFGNMM